MEYTMDELKEELAIAKYELDNLYKNYDEMVKAKNEDIDDLKRQLEAAGQKHFADADKTAPDVSKIANKDGLPIVSGDVVYGEDGKQWTVAGFDFGSEHSVVAFNGKSAKKLRPEWLTGYKPDTQEAIDADAVKDPCVYFNGTYIDKCSDCPIGSDADTCWGACQKAQRLDLLKRQRELLERGR